MLPSSKKNNLLTTLITALASWLIPGAGYFLLNQKKRAIIIFVTISATFCIGIYVGSIGVVDPVGARLAYIGQILTSPLVAILGHITVAGAYPVYGKPQEIGQIYTTTAGLLNLLCIVNATYLAYAKSTEKTGEQN